MSTIFKRSFWKFASNIITIQTKLKQIWKISPSYPQISNLKTKTNQKRISLFLSLAGTFTVTAAIFKVCPKDSRWSLRPCQGIHVLILRHHLPLPFSFSFERTVELSRGKMWYHNKLNTEAHRRIMMPSLKQDIKEICKIVKQYHSHYFGEEIVILELIFTTLY